jgi:hypothetical protein
MLRGSKFVVIGRPFQHFQRECVVSYESPNFAGSMRVIVQGAFASANLQEKLIQRLDWITRRKHLPSIRQCTF